MPPYTNENEVLLSLEEKDNNKLFTNLNEIFRERNWHCRENIIMQFHEKVLYIFQEKLKNNPEPKENYNIRWLFSRLLDLSQIISFWHKDSFKENSFIKKYKSPEKFLLTLWVNVKEKDTNAKLINWLDNNYRLIDKSMQICLKRYAFREAFLIVNKKNGTLYSLYKIFFSLPLIIGIIVGWIFLLQAGDAIKYFTMMQFLKDNILLEVIAMVGPLFLSGIYIYNHAHIENWKKIACLIFAVWVISLLIGIVFISIGYQWFLEQNNDWITNWEKTQFYLSLGKNNAVRFILVWSSMAVFIGIFAQIIWSGRGPTEISE